MQAHARKKDETRKRDIGALVAKQIAEDEASAQNETCKRMKFGVAEPTAEDDAETERCNEVLGPLKTDTTNLPFLMVGMEAEFLNGACLLNTHARPDKNIVELASHSQAALKRPFCIHFNKFLRICY